MANTTSSTTTEHDLVITRIFNAPRALVWKTWTNPEALSKWWGPKHFRATVKKLDLRTGGGYHIAMHAPEGQTFWSTGTYLEIIPLEKIVSTDGFADEHGNVVPASYYGMANDFPLEMQVTVTLEDYGRDQTKMTLHHVGVPGAVKEMTDASWNESFDKLADSVTENTGISDREIVISRTINAPRKLVWEAFTDPKHLEQWWGPNGFSTHTKEFTFAVGGQWRHTMIGPDGREYPNWSTFEEITPYKRIAYAHGGGEGDSNDAQFDATITLEDEDGKTKVTLRSVFATQALRDHIVKTYGAIEGGKQTLARLDEYVQTRLRG